MRPARRSGLALVIYALTEGPGAGLVRAAGRRPCSRGIAVLVGFVVNEAHVRDPMMPLTLFRNTQFAGANVVTLVVYAALAGALFLLPVAAAAGLGLLAAAGRQRPAAGDRGDAAAVGADGARSRSASAHAVR